MLFLFTPRAFNSSGVIPPTPPSNTGAGERPHGVRRGNEPVFDFFTGRRIDVPYEEPETIVNPEQPDPQEEADTEVPESVKFKRKGRKFSSFKDIPVAEFPVSEPYSDDPMRDLELEVLKRNALDQIAKLVKFNEEKQKNQEVVHSLANEVAKEVVRRKTEKDIDNDDEEVIAFLLARIV